MMLCEIVLYSELFKLWCTNGDIMVSSENLVNVSHLHSTHGQALVTASPPGPCKTLALIHSSYKTA
jgi:hypothetical protein